MKQIGKRMDDFLDNDDELLSPHEKEDEKRWDKEFQRRRTELEREKTKLEERKRQSSSRLENLSIRWRNLEQRRIQRNHMKRSATNMPSEVTSAQSFPERGNTTI